MKRKSHIESFLEHTEKLNISGVINRLSNWNTDRNRKNERLKIYNQYKEGVITYDEYVKQRKELEDKYRNEDNK
jgi:hypothetical protein